MTMRDESRQDDLTFVRNFADASSSASDPALAAHTGDGWGDLARRQVRHFVDLLVHEVEEHPVRSMLLASAVGFLIATSMRSRVVPALLRSGAGIAAAMAVREIAERGFGRLEVGSSRSA